MGPTNVIQGINPPVNTPFQANGLIGGDGFCVMQMLLAGVGWTTGKYYAERHRYLEVTEAVNGEGRSGLPTTINTGSQPRSSR